MKKTIKHIIQAAIITGAIILIGAPSGAWATDCVPRDAVPAYTEVVPDIEHPAVYETVVVTPATPGTPAVWANFSPNDQRATFIGPPTYPADERGTWHDHGQLPPGHAGPDGVYAKGNPDKGGNWFYRQAEVLATPEVTEERLVTEAWTEIVPDIEHPAIPAVTCEQEPTPTPDPEPTIGAPEQPSEPAEPQPSTNVPAERSAVRTELAATGPEWIPFAAAGVAALVIGLVLMARGRPA